MSKAWSLRRLVSLLAQEITPLFRTKTKLVHNPNLCTRAFAESNKFPNQGALPIGYLVSITGVGSQTIAAVFVSLGGRLTMLNMPNSNECLCVKTNRHEEKFRQFGNAGAESPWWHPLSGSWFVFYGENNAPFKLLCRARDDFGLNHWIREHPRFRSSSRIPKGLKFLPLILH